MESLGEEIKQGLRNLYDYRRHVAQKVDEKLFDSIYYSNLDRNEGVVIADYKMKILSMKHKEPQSDWFSKRGFSCLGFLIMFGSTREEKENKVLYHLFISNDTTQDAAAVNCAKAYLYKEILPKYGLKRIHYRCDGAGNFSGTEAKAAIALWPALTGVTDRSYKTSVSGDGKSNLDGLFGVLTRHLKGLVDSGASFQNAKELCALLTKNPLNHTEIHHFLPKRDIFNWSFLHAASAKQYSLSNCYLIQNNDGEYSSKTHSRHGNMVCLDDLSFYAGVELGINDKRDAKIRHLGVNDLRMELKMRNIDTRKRTKEELQKLILEHKNVSLMDEVELTQFNTGELRVLCKRNDLSTKGNVAALRQSLNGIKPSSLISTYAETPVETMNDFDPCSQILESTFGKLETSASLHSKVGFRERVLLYQQQKVSKENLKFDEKMYGEIQLLRNAGLHVCDAKDPDTNSRCQFRSQHESCVRKHKEMVEKGEASHQFPTKSLLDYVTSNMINGSYALCFATGRMENRDDAIGTHEMKDGTHIDLKCHDEIESMGIGSTLFETKGLYHRSTQTWKKPNFQASEALQEDLEDMFLHGENRNGEGKKKNAAKYTPDEAFRDLQNMKHERGGRKYSHRSDNSNGTLPTEAYIKQVFSRRKREGAKLYRKKNYGDNYDLMNLERLQEKYTELFGENRMTEKNVLIRMLEIDDEQKYGSSDDVYSIAMSEEELKIQCTNRGLPNVQNEIALRIVIRGTERSAALSENNDSLVSYEGNDFL